MADEILVRVVTQADPQVMNEAGVTERGTLLRLESAKGQLQDLLDQYPATELSKHLTDLLQQHNFYVVGPWPPDQSAGTRPSGPKRGRTCPKCGQPIP